jgi:hypothetical protein
VPSLEIVSTYQPDRIPAQQAFHSSSARVRGYGGALSYGRREEPSCL